MHNKRICHDATRVQQVIHVDNVGYGHVSSNKPPLFPSVCCVLLGLWWTEKKNFSCCRCCCIFFFFFCLDLLHRRSFAVATLMAFTLRTKSFGLGEEGVASHWWNEIDESDQWQRGIYYALCAAFASVSFVALVPHFLSFSGKILFFLVKLLLRDKGCENWTSCYFHCFAITFSFFVLVWTCATQRVSNPITPIPMWFKLITIVLICKYEGFKLRLRLCLPQSWTIAGECSRCGRNCGCVSVSCGPNCGHGPLFKTLVNTDISPWWSLVCNPHEPI